MRGVSVAPLVDRIEALSIPEPNSGCWLWLGYLRPNGYGSLGVKEQGQWSARLAHRISYEVFVGPIPAGLDLDHLCRNRACVNPDHLQPVDRSTNLRRSPLMARQRHKQTCPKGHEYSGTNIRGQRICHSCSAEASRVSYHRQKGKGHV